MRNQVVRPTVWTLLALLLASTAVGAPARAQESGLPSATSGDDSLARLIAERVALPALPPELRPPLAGDPADVTGTVLQPAPARRRAGAVPPALTFEDGPPARRTAALVTGVPGTDRTDTIPPAAAPVTEAPASPADALAEPGPAAPAPVVPAAAPPSPAATPVAVSDAPALPRLLASFAARGVFGDSPALTRERRAIREEVAAYYAAHDNAPLWTAEGRFTPRARAALARLDHAAEDGLDLTRFPVAAPRGSTPEILGSADLALSEAVVAYARQAAGSRVDVARLGGLIDLRPDIPGADRVLSALANAADAGEALRAFNPGQPGYLALRAKLAELREANPPEAQSRIPAGPVLKPGMTDARVPLIRARFGLDVARIEPGIPEQVYDTRVAAAVADFQRAHGLPASGLLTPRTVAALSGGNPRRLDNTIVANMEMWRWMPRDLAPDRVEVNIPDYTARVIRDGEIAHQTRVVVGQPDKPTPVFAQQMRFIIVNPYWNVPLSIIKNEMLPKLAADPNYFADHGYEVVEHDGQTFVRQPPGDGNALGRIKFMFPNSHSVYLHDTNARSYFGRDMRALSHGCVRVEQPFAFAEAVLGRANGWSEARVRKLVGGQERTVNLPKPLPILIGYFTAFVDPATGFQLRDDVYGYAGRVKLALNLQD